MLFAIRDDDPSYFTRPEELEAAYQDLWNRIAVSFAVIPFDVPTWHREDRERLRQGTEGVSLERNGELVRYLVRKIAEGRVDVMLHGYDHLYHRLDQGSSRPPLFVPEFVYAENKEERLRLGRDLLQRVLGVPVKVFVPPSNAIARDGLRALARVGLDQACLSDRSELLGADPRNLAWAVRTRLSRRFPFNVRRYQGHREIWCHSLTPSCDWRAMCRRLDDCAARDGAFVVATHYWERDRENPAAGAPLRLLLRELVDRAAAHRARFATVGEIFAG